MHQKCRRGQQDGSALVGVSDDDHVSSDPLRTEDGCLIPAIMVLAIPRRPSMNDYRVVERIYENDAQYLATLHHYATHNELSELALLHGFVPNEPLTAIRFVNRFSQDVILISATITSTAVRSCDHSKSMVVSRRPFLNAVRQPPLTNAHRYYAELRSCLQCTGLQIVNIGVNGDRENSAWFDAPPDLSGRSWTELHRLANTKSKSDPGTGWSGKTRQRTEPADSPVAKEGSMREDRDPGWDCDRLFRLAKRFAQQDRRTRPRAEANAGLCWLAARAMQANASDLGCPRCRQMLDDRQDYDDADERILGNAGFHTCQVCNREMMQDLELLPRAQTTVW